MIKEAFGTGNTVEEAVENAKKALAAPENANVMTEIVEMPTKKILGLFGGSQAKARAYYESSPIEKAVAYLLTILKGMGIEDAKAEAKEVDGDIVIDLDCGDDYGIVIGRRGETLDSIQYLTRLVINRENEEYKRVSINVGNYREKREKTLRSLAHKNANRVAKYGRNVTLEPMNPYERRIIHTAVQGIEGVTSASFGEGSDRRVVIGPEGAELKPLRQRRGNDNRRSRGRRPSSNNTVTSAPAREPKKDTDIPLYGKIN